MFTFERFASVMKNLELVREQQEEVYNVLRDSKYDSIANDFISPYAWSNPILEDELINALEEMYDDKNHWISYYIFELDYGKMWESGKIIDENDNDIKLENIEDL